MSPWHTPSDSVGSSRCISAHSNGYRPIANAVHSADNPSVEEGIMEKPWYFIQLSDTHIVADTHQESHGVNTYATLSRAITQISSLDPPPAFVIFTGDLINDDDPQSYRVLKQLTDQLRVPTYFAMGNHDLRQPFRQVFLGAQQPDSTPYYYTFDSAQYRF